MKCARPIILALLAPLALGGCSSMFAGMAAGGAGGLTGPGAAAVKITDCDLSAEGSIPLTGVSFACSTDGNGGMQKTATIQSANPENILLQAFTAQAAQAQATAQLLQQLIPLLAQAGATAAGGPVAGAVAGAVLKPKSPAVPAPVSGQGVTTTP